MTDDKRVIDALNESIDDLLMGQSVEASLGLFPDYRDQLEPLLAAVIAAREADSVPPRPVEAIAAGKAGFLAAAAEQRSRAKPAPVRQRRRIRLPRVSWPALGRAPAWSAVAAAVVLVLVLATGGTVVAAASTLPGDALYPVKRAVQTVQISFTIGAEARDALQERFDQQHQEEVQQVLETGRVVRRLDFSGSIDDLMAGRWIVSGLTLHLDSQTLVEGTPESGARVWVEAEIALPGRLVARRIRVLAPPAPSAAAPPTEEPSPTATATSTPEPTPTDPPTPTPFVDEPTPEAVPLEVQEPTAAPTSKPVVEPSSTATATPTATATATATSSPTATETATLTPPPPSPTAELPRPVRVTGVIESMSGDTWSVSGQSVLVTGATAINESAGKATEGATVWVTAVPREGLLIATSITVEAPAPEPVQF
ncbi:MAG TPA: DUF5666 domain-containing protein, partial [Anaerolineae bacterium]|nr:DUF5666 domain-containing protein [Anaerolineae bacterium]